MPDYEKRRTPKSTPIPTYDPAPSGDFAAQALTGANITGVLIGRLAVWSWLAMKLAKHFRVKIELTSC